MQLIYDHLEKSVFAPRSCSYPSCTNLHCDGYNCYTSFAHDDFDQAESYFTDNLLPLVENVKLDRPADSLPPLTRSTYVAQETDWRDTEDSQATSWNESEQLWQEESYDEQGGTHHEEEPASSQDADEEENYTMQVEEDHENQSHSDEEGDESYE